MIIHRNINFGDSEDPLWKIVKFYVNTKKVSLSKLVRDALEFYLTVKDSDAVTLVSQYKHNSVLIGQLLERRRFIKELLKDKGIDVEKDI